MKVLNHTETLQVLCRSTRKYGMFLSYDWVKDLSEVPKACPILVGHDQAIIDGSSYVLFDSEEELFEAYSFVVGDEGPTKLNRYNGTAKVYALTCGPDGEFGVENT